MGKKSKSTTSKTVYGNTTTVNPYVTSKTNNSGTTSVFNPGTALNSVNQFVNKNMDKLLEEYLNPTLDSVTNRSKINSFINNLNTESLNNLENNIINPLSRRNMVRSSQATDLYKNMQQNNANQISDYMSELLSSSQKDTASMLANLMLMYMNGYNVLEDTQAQSLRTSQGNATRTQTGEGSALDTSQLMQLTTQMALLAAGII